LGYRHPSFNILVNLWTNGSYPAAPRVTTAAQFQWGKHNHINYSPPAASFSMKRGFTEVTEVEAMNVPLPAMLLCLPIDCDVRDICSTSGADLAEIPANSNRFYTVQYQDVSCVGFTNQYRIAIVTKNCPFITPDVIPEEGTLWDADTSQWQSDNSTW
jgi:hypothetical protein